MGLHTLDEASAEHVNNTVSSSILRHYTVIDAVLGTTVRGPA
jgi:hypothetical protein